MTISVQSLAELRRRAGYACEYCGVQETDTGGELTVDHFQPQAHGGTDDLSNLLYCCHRCNLYKADYWQNQPSDIPLWNPRQESADSHFVRLLDGSLYPITRVSGFTIGRLRLNRPALVAYRRRKQSESEEFKLLARYREVIALLERLQQQQAALLEDHRALLEEQKRLLRLLGRIG
jgi:hypothetical protein